MSRNDDISDAMIDALVADLRPVRAMALSRGLWLVAASFAVTVLATALSVELRPDLAAMAGHPIPLLASGLFLMLGLSATVTVLMMGRPYVGTDHGGWRWAAAMAALLPVTALIMLGAEGIWGVGDSGGHAHMLARSAPEVGLRCLRDGFALALISGAALCLWLRMGAPTSPERAGLVTGVAAGCTGVFAFSLHCPDESIYHIGIWHSLTVVLTALAGRWVVPPLIRW